MSAIRSQYFSFPPYPSPRKAKADRAHVAKLPKGQLQPASEPDVLAPAFERGLVEPVRRRLSGLWAGVFSARQNRLGQLSPAMQSLQALSNTLGAETPAMLRLQALAEAQPVPSSSSPQSSQQSSREDLLLQAWCES